LVINAFYEWPKLDENVVGLGISGARNPGSPSGTIRPQQIGVLNPVFGEKAFFGDAT
jgi:hypothetical protein